MECFQTIVDPILSLTIVSLAHLSSSWRARITATGSPPEEFYWLFKIEKLKNLKQNNPSFFCSPVKLFCVI